MIPNKAFQALACGTPLVTADTPAARELLVDGESALLVPPGDPRRSPAHCAGSRPTPRCERASAHGGLAAYRQHASEDVLGRRWLRLLERRRAVKPARLALAIAAFAAGFGALAVLRHRSFDTGRFDLGNMTQAVWSTANGDPLAVTDLDGEQTTRLASHFDPILVLFAPLWSSGRAPSCCSSRRRSRSRSARCPSSGSRASTSTPSAPALGFALAYLLFPPGSGSPLSSSTRSRSPARCCCSRSGSSTRTGSCRSRSARRAALHDEGGVASPSPGWALVRARDRAPGPGARSRSPAGVGRARSPRSSSCPHFAPGRRSAVREPLRLADARRRATSRYLAALLLPLAFLPLAAPLALLPALPDLGLNLLSTTVTQTSVNMHYAATAIPRSARGGGLRRRPGRRAGGRTSPHSAGRSAGAIPLGPVGAHRHRRRRRTTPRPGERSPLVPDGVARQRDQLARRAPLRPAAHPQLPDSARPNGSPSTRRRLTFLDSLAARARTPGARARSARPGLAARLRGGRRARLPATQVGIACGSRYAQKPSEISCARRSSSAAASGTAQIAYHGVSQGVVASSRHPSTRASPGRVRPPARAR